MGFPRQLDLVQSLGDSVDIESGQDDLDSPARYGRWLTAHGYPAAADPSAGDLDLALAVRAAIRDELIAEHIGDEAAVAQARARLDEAAGRVPLRASFNARPASAGAGGLDAASAKAALVPAEGRSATDLMLAEVLTALVRAEEDGSRRRLKICHEDSCRSVFYDRSKNGSKTWCSMQICGNRNKTRSYRGRQRDGGVTETS